MKKMFIFIILLFVILNVYSSNYPKGDVDGDNSVTFKDYVLIRKHILKDAILKGNELTRADVDEDKEITFRDYVLVRKIILKEDINDKEKEELKIYFYNPGFKSDAIFIISGNKTMVIDGGYRDYNGKNNGFINYLKELQKELKFTNIDYYIGTHGHEDHVDLAGKIIKEFNIKTIYVPKGDIPEVTKVQKDGKIENINTKNKWYTNNNKVYKNYAIVEMLKVSTKEERQSIEKATINELIATNTFNLGNSKITILNPYNSNWPSNDIETFETVDSKLKRTNNPLNNNSLMLRIDFNKTSFLLAADVWEADVYSKISSKVSKSLLDTDVYKNGHHHYRLLTTTGELKARFKAITPDITVMTTDTIDISNTTINEIKKLSNMCIYSLNDGNVTIKSNGCDIETIGNPVNNGCNKKIINKCN